MDINICQDERGISLAETIVAIAILAIVGGIVLAGIFVSVKSNQSNITHISAESLARSELEYVKAGAYHAAPWGYTLPGGYPSWDTAHNSLPAGYSGYTVAVSSVSMGYSPDTMQKISVIVRYSSGEIIRMETYRAQ